MVNDPISTFSGLPAQQQDPVIISGGMGIWISCWVMSRIVSLLGGMGIVSGTALDIVYARILQQGDPGGHVRRAFAELSRRVPALELPLKQLLKNYFIENGKPALAPFKATPTGKLTRVPGAAGPASLWEPNPEFQLLTLAANFAEVWLAKEGHAGKVGINYLRKVERPLPWGLYGAMLAGVDYVAMGAGSPAEIPGIIDKLSRHEAASLALRVYGTDSNSGEFAVCIRPDTLGAGAAAPALPKPKFLAIVSSFALAEALASNPVSRPYGFIIEGSVAGGHNAPPGRKAFNKQGDAVVIYTEADAIDVKAIAGLGLPFWMAGAYGSPERLAEALALGASGIQFGTAAALSGQSGLAPELRNRALEMISRNALEIKTDGRTSPSGFPFKVAQIPGTLSDEKVYSARKRVCDIGFLQSAYLTPQGDLRFRCPAENEEEYVRKGGKVPHTKGRVCLCNGLLATAGFPQTWASGYKEPPIVTLGDDLTAVRRLMETLPPGHKTYSIGKAFQYIASALDAQKKTGPGNNP
ncbi:MAG: nitronate monooxygenase [Elusimicrobiota bacterium]